MLLAPRLLLLLPTLLLAACGQQQNQLTSPGATVNSADPQTTGKLYEVSFQRIGAADFNVTAQRLPTPELQAQRLVDGPSGASDLTFTQLGVSTFVVNAAQTRHVRATFRVTNNSGQALNELVFLPVISSGSSTPFTNLKYFDGSDASSKAGSLTPTQGKSLKPSTGQAVVDADSSPFVTNLDVSTVITPGIQNYGWQVTPSLANGASTNVTFAVDLPIDPAGAAHDPFSFSLRFAAAVETTQLRSAVQQYHRDTQTFGNYTQFPMSSGSTPRSLPAYYDILTSTSAVLCSDSGVSLQDISTLAFPHRFRVEVTAKGDHTLSVYDGTSCPVPGSVTPLLTQTITGINPFNTAIAGGLSHSLAVKADGTVRAWGGNGFGQLGDGTTTVRSTPVLVSGLTDVVGVASGSNHSLAVKADGSVRTWGYNNVGQLGDGTRIRSSSPVTVSGLTDVISVSGGYQHSLALKVDGTVQAWGDNADGQLGNSTVAFSSTPVTVSGLTDVVSVTGGFSHSLALKADGTVWAWGRNDYGELGDGTRTTRSTPVTVGGLTDVVSVVAANQFSLALKPDGTVRAWGSNNAGQLSDGTTTKSVSGLAGVVSVAGGYSHSLALKADGTVRTWGLNSSGQLGDGTTTARSTPVTVSGLTDAVSVASGGSYSLAVKTDGSVRTWGRNTEGQLGNGTMTNSSMPVLVSGLTGVAQPTP
ncbi:RCC1 domain-containing protein [Deinococcus hopiensis]|uniref:Alpha-tubulin suppressor n=1 Tax=Deinococcus hopiensis KR-140 TaxID=695939 RepID=A0A1W1UZ57_9DEIO|nr:RCC1 domain-containing protein [Deinococcus hopiensis]SMB86383.1 Alpha-tubulin suppressor [Deinococcus hopiensis KR-140]